MPDTLAYSHRCQCTSYIHNLSAFILKRTISVVTWAPGPIRVHAWYGPCHNGDRSFWFGYVRVWCVVEKFWLEIWCACALLFLSTPWVIDQTKSEEKTGWWDCLGVCNKAQKILSVHEEVTRSKNDNILIGDETKSILSQIRVYSNSWNPHWLH